MPPAVDGSRTEGSHRPTSRWQRSSSTDSFNLKSPEKISCKARVISLIAHDQFKGQGSGNCQERVQRTARIHVGAADKHRRYTSLFGRQFMRQDQPLFPSRRNDGLGQKRDAHSSRNTAQNGIQGAEFQCLSGLNASLRQQVFQALTIRTAVTKDDDLQVSLPVKVIKVSQRWRRNEHQLFPETRHFQE